MRDSAEDSGDGPACIVNHRDDTRIIHMARAQNTNRANDLLFSIMIGRNDQRTAGIDEQFVLGTDENLDAFALSGRR